MRCQVCDRPVNARGACPVHGTPATLVDPDHATAPAIDGRDTGEDLLAGTAIESYVIEGVLGEGGMGRVYAARHPVIGKRAAVKVLRRDRCARPNAVERFVREARAVNQIRHPNIVDVFAIGALDDGRSYLVMEQLEGESVRERLRRGSPLPVREACDILTPMCRALDAAHAAGIVHRDLKPDNVFLVEVPGEPPLVKLLDFGIAKLDEADAPLASTDTGAMLGTPGYMSPEQARGPDIDARADVYSLGAMAYEMVTGRRPFEAPSAAEVISMLLTRAPEPPRALRPELPRELDRMIAAMLAKDPGARPSLAEVRAVLERARAAPEAPAPAGARWWIAVAGAGAVAAAVAAAVMVATGDEAVRPAAAPIDAAAPDAASPPDAAPPPAPPDAAPPPDAVRGPDGPRMRPASEASRRSRRKPDAAPPPAVDDDAPIDPFAGP